MNIAQKAAFTMHVKPKFQLMIDEIKKINSYEGASDKVINYYTHILYIPFLIL